MSGSRIEVELLDRERKPMEKVEIVLHGIGDSLPFGQIKQRVLREKADQVGKASVNGHSVKAVRLVIDF